MHNGSLHKIVTYNRVHNDPPYPVGMAITATLLLPVPEHWDLYHHAKNTYQQYGHATAGTTQRLLATKFWHPESTLAVQQMLAECPSCQFMKPPDPALPNLVSIIPPPLFTRWVINYTFWEGSVIVVMIEYATSWVKASVIPSKKWKHILLLLIFVQHYFNALRKLVNDNANKFSGNHTSDWQRNYGT
jgi:hypothetical protein